MNVLEALRTVSAYPIPTATFQAVATSRGLTLTDLADYALMTGRTFRLAMADLMRWLTMAPNVTQGGQTYTLNEEDRRRLSIRANAIYEQLGEETEIRTTFGYKGERL